jgi:aminopeptidase N
LTLGSLAVHRRTVGLLLIACLGTYLAACATSPGVISTEAKSNQSSSADTTVPTTATGSSEPADTSTGAATTTTVATPASDEDGIGDTLFPSLGNPGIDVQHYTLKLQYDPTRNKLSGTEHLDVTMTEDRDAFTLDSDGPVVSAVLVDGTAATFVATSPELHITPVTPLTTGQQVGVDVTYTLSPEPVQSNAGGQVGWFPTPGGSYVLNEPEGARTWMPSDDHPSDKATYRFELTVSQGLTAVANGALVEHTSTTLTDTWIWQEDRPMATYQIQVLTGDYEIVTGTGPNGLPLVSAVMHKDSTTMQPFLDTMSEQIDFFDDFFGPYPLDRYGIAMVDSTPGVAMETMERPFFCRTDFLTGQVDTQQQTFLSHELAHQWFGDSVSPARWKDVWLNESFATYGEWMWLDHVGLRSIEDSASEGLVSRTPWSTADPNVGEMFQNNSYDGGAVILHALRKTIGDDLFFTLLRRWISDNNGTSRTTEDLVALANQVAGQDLTTFFATWLYAAIVPTTFPG